MIIIGRNNDLLEKQKFDFEIMKRKDASVIDIITHDDLLRRHKNFITRVEGTAYLD